jgi:competence protein ComEC
VATADVDQAGARRAPGARLWNAANLGRLWALARAEARAQAERWFLWSPAAFGAGCIAYFVAPNEPPLWLGAVLAAVALALCALARAQSRLSGLLIAANLAAFIACGFFAAELRRAAVGAPVIWRQTSGEVEGWVIDVAGPGSGGGGRLLIAPYRIGSLARGELPARIRVTVAPDALIGPGESVRLKALLNPPPEPASPGAYDFARDSYFQSVGGVGFSLSEPLIIAGPKPPPLLGLQMSVNAARWSLARRIIDQLGPREGGIAVAMTTGHEAWLQPDEVQAMRDSGLAHILSISGVHMAIVGGFVFLSLRTLIAAWPWLALRVSGKKLAAAGGLIATGVYLIVSGAPPPAVRSAVTLSVAFCAILADRRAISLHALAVAALIVLVLQPEAVVQPGFQMSFAATLALIALAQVWPHPPREINTPWPIRLVQGAITWLAMGIAVSLAASLATDSYAIQHFNRISLYGVPSNLLMEPLSTFLIMPALAAGALLECFGAGGWLLDVAGWGIWLLNALAKGVAAWPRAVWIVPSAPAIALPIASLGLLWLCLWKGRLRWLGVPAALAVLVWPRPPAPDVWVASDGGAAAISDHGRAILLRPDAKQFAVDLWARRRGLTEPKDPKAALEGRFDCDRRRCLPLAGAQPRIAAWWTRRRPSGAAMAGLCDGAEIVLLRGSGDGCAGALVLTGRDFARGGSAEIWRTSGGWRLDWANDERGARPWTQPRTP